MTCETCDGLGVIEDPDFDPRPKPFIDTITCPDCNGMDHHTNLVAALAKIHIRHQQPLTADTVSRVLGHFGGEKAWHLYWCAETSLFMQRWGWQIPVFSRTTLWRRYLKEVDAKWHPVRRALTPAIGLEAARAYYRVQRILVAAETCPRVRVEFHKRQDDLDLQEAMRFLDMAAAGWIYSELKSRRKNGS